MHPIPIPRGRWLAAVLCGLLATLAHGAAGEFRFVEGEVAVLRPDGQRVPAARGAAIDEGDVIESGRDGHAQLRMADEAILAIRPETRVRIRAYGYDPADRQSARSVLDLFKGVLRSLSGHIGRVNRDAVRIHTATATIGIRGTDHEAAYVPPPGAGEAPVAPPGTYDRVIEGGTWLESAAGRLELGPAETGFAPADLALPPVRLAREPEFLRQRAPVREAPGGARMREDPDREAPRGRPQAPRAGALGAVPAPLPVVIAAVRDGSFDPRQAPAGSTAMPPGTATVGGDYSPARGLGSGGGVVGAGDNPYRVQVDTQSGLPDGVAGGDFSYVRAAAPLLETGRTGLADGSEVRWGIYGGGVIVDAQGRRDVRLFHFMSGPGMPLSGRTGTATYQRVLGGTTPINEAGQLGGAVLEGGTRVSVNLGTGQLTAYELSVRDARNLVFQGQYQGPPVGLEQFITRGIALDAKCSDPFCRGGGSAQGMPVGTAGAGLVTSYDLNAGGKGVTGSVLLGR